MIASRVAKLWVPRIVLILTFVVLAVHGAKADDAKASITVMIEEQARIDRYVELDFARQDLLFHQTSTILALYGDYNSYTKSDGTQANGSDMTRFRNRVTEYVPAAIVDFRRKSQRDKTISEDEASKAEAAEALMDEMVLAAGEIIELCDANKPYEASLVYRDKTMPLNTKLLGLLYTLRSTSVGRFKKAALKAKYQ